MIAPDHPQVQALSQLWGAHRLRGRRGMRGARLGHPLRAERVHCEINHPRRGPQLRLHAPGAWRRGPGPRLQPSPPDTQPLHLLLHPPTMAGSPPALIPEGPGYLSPALEACWFCQCPVHRRASWVPAAALAAVLAQVRGRAHQLTRESRALAEESWVQTGLAPCAPMCTSVDCMCMSPCTYSHVALQRCLCPQVARSPTLPQVSALRLEKSQRYLVSHPHQVVQPREP